MRDLAGLPGLLAGLPADVLPLANHLKVVSRHGVGYDNIPVEALTARGIPLALAIGANAESVAEQVLAFTFALAKRMPALDRAVEALSVRLTPQDMEKVAENIALLSRHRGILRAALAREAASSDQ